jgi:hypothetical protein
MFGAADDSGERAGQVGEWIDSVELRDALLRAADERASGRQASWQLAASMKTTI